MAQMTSTHIINSRLFNGTIEQVWSMWSESENLKKWWGPKGFTNTFYTHEFKNEGKWIFTMHGPDGTSYANEMRYRLIVPYSEIQMDHICEPFFSLKVLFEEKGNQTRIVFDADFKEEAVLNAVKDVVILANEENFDRMDAVLSSITGKILPNELIISKTFNTSIETMWKMWTEPSFMAKWIGPKDLRTTYTKMNFQRGGDYHYCMATPDGNEMWGKVYYLDIIKEQRLLYINTFSNEKGELKSHPMASEWPKELLTFITFKKEAHHQTTITLRWTPLNANESEIKFFNESHSNMKQGWSGSLDRLESALNEKISQ